MDLSRSIKRLALIVLLAIVVILISKSLLSKAAKNLSVEAELKQQAKAARDAANLPVSAVEPASDSPLSDSDAVIYEPESAALATHDSAVTQ